MLLCAVQTGVCIWLLWELIRLFGLFSKTTVMRCFFQDVFFCVIAALVTFFAFLGFADGNIYPYLLLGEAIGFCIPYFTIGRIWRAISASLIRVCKRLFRPIKQRILRRGEEVANNFFAFIGNFRDSLFEKIRKMYKKTKKIQKKS